MPLSTKDIPVDSTRLILMCGPADSGKSFAATSFGLAKDDRPCYILELDGRLAALRNRPVVYDAFTNVEGAVGVLNRVKDLRKQCVEAQRAPFHTLILDSFTTYNDFAIADSQDITINQSGDKGRKRGELQMLTVQDYGYEGESWRQLMYENLFDIKRYANVIVTAHEVDSYKPVKTAPGEPTRTEYDGVKILAHGNKIAARIPTKFDEIYRFMKKEEIVAKRSIRRQVKFLDGDLARTSIPALQKLGTVAHDISDKEFYPWWHELISK